MSSAPQPGPRASSGGSPITGSPDRPVASHARLRMLESTLQCIDYGVVAVDSAGRFQFFNEAAQKLLGLGALDLEPESWSETYGCFWPDRVTPFPSEELPLARALRGERVREVEIFVRNRRIPDGVWISVSGTPLVEPTGAPAGATVVFRDVTAQHRAQGREVEMRLARMIQQKLYPAEAPVLPSFDLAGATFPADSTCGDYYDFIPMDGGRLGVAVGDVSGHGFGPALLMAETRAYLRSLSKATDDVGWIMGRLNAFLCEDTEDERFITLMLLLLDPRERTLVYSSAGHVPGYVIGDTGVTRHILESTAIPLGIFPEAEVAASPQIALEDGDLFVLLTDGASEAQDAEGRFFETERIEQVLSGLREAPAHEIISGLHDAVSVFASAGPPTDDITAVVGKVQPPR